jgi:NADP-dependent 3-hydroxy acid dehydrogenase YdfG
MQVQRTYGCSISDPATKDLVATWFRAVLDPEAIARAIAYAIDQPDDVDVNEAIVRPVAQRI